MKHGPKATARPIQRQRGFVLVLAVFMLVSLASIAAYLLTLSNLQVEGAVRDELGARAFQSARTGIDWGAYQILRAPAQPFATTCAAGTSSQTIALTGELAGFSVAISCQAGASQTEGASSYRAYSITATACNQASCPGTAGADYVERQVKISVVN
jgi:MSHA biogenesis protein MshP